LIKTLELHSGHIQTLLIALTSFNRQLIDLTSLPNSPGKTQALDRLGEQRLEAHQNFSNDMLSSYRTINPLIGTFQREARKYLLQQIEEIQRD
jgi:hypothetical protein